MGYCLLPCICASRVILFVIRYTLPMPAIQQSRVIVEAGSHLEPCVSLISSLIYEGYTSHRWGWRLACSILIERRGGEGAGKAGTVPDNKTLYVQPFRLVPEFAFRQGLGFDEKL